MIIIRLGLLAIALCLFACTSVKKIKRDVASSFGAKSLSTSKIIKDIERSGENYNVLNFIVGSINGEINSCYINILQKKLDELKRERNLINIFVLSKDYKQNVDLILSLFKISSMYYLESNGEYSIEAMVYLPGDKDILTVTELKDYEDYKDLNVQAIKDTEALKEKFSKYVNSNESVQFINLNKKSCEK